MGSLPSTQLYRIELHVRQSPSKDQVEAPKTNEEGSAPGQLGPNWIWLGHMINQTNQIYASFDGCTAECMSYLIWPGYGLNLEEPCFPRFPAVC